jgi:hypothetical protein
MGILRGMGILPMNARKRVDGLNQAPVLGMLTGGTPVNTIETYFLNSQY